MRLNILYLQICCVARPLNNKIYTGAMVPPGQVEAAEQPAGYLAAYVAAYEYNMGVEHAQFPSGTYTDTCRTDVLYYGLSKDGVHFEGLNNDKAVYYPKEFHSLGSPVIFRKVVRAMT